jgi:type II secretion system protein H
MWCWQPKGFTTTELLIAVAMIGMLAGIATPSLQQWLSTMRVDTAAREMAATLQLSKMRAVTENTRYRMSFDLSHNAYVSQRESLGAWHNVEAPTRLPAGLRLVSVSAGRNPLYFEPLGTAPGGNAVITLQNARGRTRTVSISTGGRVKVQ